MWYQAIPFCLITILLVLVIARASKTSLLSIFTLGVIAINFLCAVFLHLHPRSGRPFVSLSAMVFFGVAYGILCLPLLFVKRQRERAKSGPPCELSTRMFLVLSTALIVVTLPVSLYDLWIGVKGLYTYATSGMSREAYRRAYAIKEVGGVQELCFILESFSYCALFLAAVGLVHFSRFRFVNVLLCIGGLAPAFWSYSIVARNVAFQMVFFYGLAVVVLGSSFGQCGRLWFVRIFFRPEMVCFLSVTVLPFVLITVLRFVPALAPLEYKKVIAGNGTAKPVVVQESGKAVAGNGTAKPVVVKKDGKAVAGNGTTKPVVAKKAGKAVAGNGTTKPVVAKKDGKVRTDGGSMRTVVAKGSNKEGLFYSSFSYFCTGAYSFNADYVARYEKGLPCLRGALTLGPVVKVVDLVAGTSMTQTAKEVYTGLHLANPYEWPRSIYRELADCYSGEFKTMVGHIVLDYPQWGAMLFCIVMALAAGLVFAFMSPGTLAYNLLKIVYCYTLLYGLMLWPWRSVRQGLILFWLLGLVLLLWILSRRNRKYGE